MIIAIEANSIKDFNEKIKEVESEAESVIVSSSNCFRVDSESSYYEHYTAILEVTPLSPHAKWIMHDEGLDG